MQSFLATCALGFRDPIVPTGLWSTPKPTEICAVSGGYAYVIDTTAPERFTMILYRPVLEIRPVPAESILLFVGHHSILAWGAGGQAWQSEKLSDEGVTITAVGDGILRERLIANHRILIRNCDSYEGLTPGRYMRVAVRAPEENDRLVESLQTVLAANSPL